MSLYLAAVWQRLEELPWYAKIIGLIGAALSTLIGDFLTGVLLLAAAASLIDWYYGRAVARSRSEFSAARATAGWQVKSGTLLVVLVIRGIEAWLSTAPQPFGLNTHGIVAAAIALGILADELDSIDENLRELGGRGIPILSGIIAWLRDTAARFAAVPRPPHGG